MSTFLASPLAPPPPIAGGRSVLVVDDEPGIRTALTAHFVREGWQVTSASGVREAEYRLSQGQFDLLVSDVRLPDGAGSDLVRKAQAQADTPVVLLTAFGTVPDAVAAMRAGASDYLVKPVAWGELHALAERLTETAGKFVERAANGFSGGIVGRAPALLAALSRARAAARTDADVLIQGEGGTGKELLARFIHDGSDRAGKPLVTVNCAGGPEQTLESELFGHARGAFTGATEARRGKLELADGGTLLLDNVGDLPIHLQPKLLRALQERECERLGESETVKVNIRVIATADVSLASAVHAGRFRSDLYYRLNVVPLTIPALRERTDDIALLAAYFAASWAAAGHRPAPLLTPAFLEEMSGRAWPGNVRELSNFMRRILSLHEGKEGGHRGGPRKAVTLDRACFLREAGEAAVSFAQAEPFGGGSDPMPIRQLERAHLEKTLAMTRGNRTHAAEMLGISLRTMRNKIREYGLPPRRYA